MRSSTSTNGRYHHHPPTCCTTTPSPAVYMNVSSATATTTHRWKKMPWHSCYARVVVTMSEDYRSMFVTFSWGQAVERDEIFSYFREYVLFQLVDTCMLDCYTLDL